MAAHGLGVLAGAVVAFFNYLAYAPKEVGFWIARDDRLLAVGYVYLYCIFVFYALVTLYVVRNVGIAFFLRALIAQAELRMLPLHPDKSGGLGAVGYIGLRNQYALTILGINVIVLVAITYYHLSVPGYVLGLIVAAILAYVLLGPLVFLGPLLPFRKAMLKNKSELMGDVAQRLRMELGRIRGQLRSGPISKEDEELVERLRKVAAVIDDLPVWPFNAGTIRRFLTAYVGPLVSLVPLGTVLKYLLELAHGRAGGDGL